jgi:hypothetical protein
MQNMTREMSDKIFNFSASFLGEYENLSLLENGLLKKDILPIWQYANYLSRVAFCIEVGIKTIINIKDGVNNVHHLDKLFDKMPNIFQEMVEKKTGKTKEAIKMRLNKIKNIFVEFRYMENNNLTFFIDKSVLNNGNIIFSKVSDIKEYSFIRLLLEEIMRYYNYLYININKNLFSSLDSKTEMKEILKIYHEELRRVQLLSYVGEEIS